MHDQSALSDEWIGERTDPERVAPEAIEFVRGALIGSGAALADAAAAMTRVEGGVEEAWLRSMMVDDRALSEQLADASRSFERAARLLNPGGLIG